jgi:effector-binding domain-containing protein
MTGATTKLTRFRVFGEMNEEDDSLAIEPKLEHRAERPYVAIPIEVTLREWGEANALVPEVFEWLGRNGLQLAGPPFFRYWVIGSMDEPFRLDVGVPLDEPVEGDGRVIVGSIPAGTYLTYVHHGLPDKLFETQQALENWAQSNGLAWQNRVEDGTEIWGGRFLFFLTNPDDEPDLNKWSTEVAYLTSNASARHAAYGWRVGKGRILT